MNDCKPAPPRPCPCPRSHARGPLPRTDALGLGDVVAPSILAGWAHRLDLRLAQSPPSKVDDEGVDDEGVDDEGVDDEGADSLARVAARDEAGDEAGGGYLASVLVGYGAGCVLLEVVPPGLGRAALLFLVPSCRAAVIGRLALRGELELAITAPGE